MLAYITWDVDPEAFNLLGREIRWYGILWATGVALAAIVVGKIFKKEKHPEKWVDSFCMYVLIGLIIGARLGHCLFYDFTYYITHPLELLYVWEGGLASHGGAIGMTIAVWLFCHRIAKKSFIWGLDRLVVGVTIGATFIRLGNLMNSEVYGGPTSLPWGFKFIRDPWWHIAIEQGGSGGLPVHPTQLYEAAVYFCIFLLGLYLFWKTNAKDKQGLILGISLIGIFGSRFIIELIKNVQEDFELSLLNTIGMNMGQLLSLPFVIWGIWLVWNALKKNTKNTKNKNTKHHAKTN